MTRRTQPTFFGPGVTTWPRGAKKHQLTLPGLDPLAERQLDADSLREWLEKLRLDAVPVDDETPHEDDR